MSTAAIDDEWDVSPADLAKKLKVSVRTVWGWNAAGTSPEFIRCGKHVRYSRSSVQKWIEDAKAKARIEAGRAA